MFELVQVGDMCSNKWCHWHGSMVDHTPCGHPYVGHMWTYFRGSTWSILGLSVSPNPPQGPLTNGAISTKKWRGKPLVGTLFVLTFGNVLGGRRGPFQGSMC